MDTKILISLFAIFQLAHCSCPPGFDLVSDGQCRGYYTTINSYRDQATEDTIKKCQEINAQPITIHNQEQQTYWTNAMRIITPTDDNWAVIGLVCNAATKRWEWADGSAVDYKSPLDCWEHFSELDQSCSTPYTWAMRADGCWSRWGWSHQSYATDVFCTTQLQQPPHSPDGCDGFEGDSDDGVCYQIGTTVVSWQDAQKQCSNFGANLASIHNLQENSFVRRLAVSRGALNGVYLGATSSGKGKEYGWIDGTAWDYQNFYAGFPVDGQGNCVAMDTASSTSGEWVNTDCNSKLSVACVRKPGIHACPSGPWIPEQIMTSPGFPFDASIACDFMLSVEAGKRVELEVIVVEANSCCDHLILYENSIGGTILADLTGEMSNRVYKTKSSNFMRVSWKPSGGVNVKGAMFTFRAVR